MTQMRDGRLLVFCNFRMVKDFCQMRYIFHQLRFCELSEGIMQCEFA